MTKVLVLGATGMLGSAVASSLSRAGLEVITASRTQGKLFDAEKPESKSLLESAGIGPGGFVVNCVGLTKARIDEASLESRSLAVKLNIDFPSNLALAAEQAGARVIQVATDCVFSGVQGGYLESDAHDAEDVYGKTKSIGEVPSESVMHLRCSLIGPESGRNSLFFEWVRQQPKGAEITGFTNHLWNGLSSGGFGRVVAGIIEENLFRSGVQHLVPMNQVTKNQLVRLELAALERFDVDVRSAAASSAVDRTLATLDREFNEQLFLAGGYAQLPTIEELVLEACANLPN
jgi:dTDP-4-dehydrorhamnose reductase